MQMIFGEKMAALGWGFGSVGRHFGVRGKYGTRLVIHPCRNNVLLCAESRQRFLRIFGTVKRKCGGAIQAYHLGDSVNVSHQGLTVCHPTICGKGSAGQEQGYATRDHNGRCQFTLN